MPASVTKTQVWAATIEDRSGGLAQKLEALADAGADLEFVISRRAPERPGTGVVFVTGLKGAKQVRAAQAAGFSRSDSLHSVRLEVSDRPGLCARVTRRLANAGISLRGFSAAATGRQCVVNFSFDKAADATAAMRLLKQLAAR